MQIQSTTRYYFTPVGMAITKMTRDQKCWWGSGEKSTLVHCVWKCKLIQPLWKILESFLKNLKLTIKIEPYIPAIPFRSIYPMVMKSRSWRVICTLKFTATLVKIATIWKYGNNLSVHLQMNEEDVIYIYLKCSHHKKEMVITWGDNGIWGD